VRVIAVSKPAPQQLDEALAEVSRFEVTYDEVGSTLDQGMPCYSRTVDLGHDTFDAAVAGLRAWACHDGIGANVYPTDAPLVSGTTLLVVLRVGPVRLLVPDRVVGVVDEPNRFGFAYGTLPGHPERGEEAFLVERHPDGRATATIRVAAEGDWLIARLAAPIVRRLQHAALNHYLVALQRYVNDTTRTVP
jgi:uncharacterized protein (UPF0548 family)